MCRYLSYFFIFWGLVLGTFYAYMLYEVINGIKGLAGPIGAFQALLGGGGLAGLSNSLGGGKGSGGASSFLDSLGSKTSGSGAKKPSPGEDSSASDAEIDASKEVIYRLINEKLSDEKKRNEYLREFLPDTGLNDHNFKEMNDLLKDFKFENLKAHIEDLQEYVSENVEDEEVRKKTLAKLEEFAANTSEVDESISRLATHIMKEEL